MAPYLFCKKLCLQLLFKIWTYFLLFDAFKELFHCQCTSAPLVNLMQRPKQLGDDELLQHLTMCFTIPWIECWRNHHLHGAMYNAAIRSWITFQCRAWNPFFHSFQNPLFINMYFHYLLWNTSNIRKWFKICYLAKKTCLEETFRHRN